MEHGKYTADLGRRLSEDIKSSGRRDLTVLFDHGRQGESTRVVPYFGDYGRSTTLAFVDVTVANKNTKSVAVLCEVEEEGVTPKKVLGDCFNIFISDYAMIGGTPYDLSHTQIVLGVRASEKGDSRSKVTAMLDRIMSVVKEPYRRDIVLLEPVFAEDNESLVLRLEDRIIEILGV